MSSAENQIKYCNNKINELLKLDINHLTEPSLFEYYCSIVLTLHHNEPFYVWKDISPQQKND